VKTQRGVNITRAEFKFSGAGTYTLTDEAEKKIRAAGGDSELLLAIARTKNNGVPVSDL